MEVNESTNQDTVTESAPATTEPETTASSTEGEPATSTEAEEFVPDFKFKVHDEEMEIDEFYRPLIKDKDSLEKVKTMHLKAMGLPKVQEGRDRYKKERDDYLSRYTDVNQKFTTQTEQMLALKRVLEQDPETAMQALGIPEKAVINYAKRILDLHDADPQTRTEMENRRKRDMEYYQLQSENQRLNQMYASQAEYQHNLSLEAALGDPDIASVAKEVDAKLGPGKFMEEVKFLGNHLFQSKGYVPPENVVPMVAQKYKAFVSSQQNSHIQQPANGGQVKPKTVIPNIGSGAPVSPTKKKFKTVEELQAYANTLEE